MRRNPDFSQLRADGGSLLRQGQRGCSAQSRPRGRQLRGELSIEELAGQRILLAQDVCQLRLVLVFFQPTDGYSLVGNKNYLPGRGSWYGTSNQVMGSNPAGFWAIFLV